jgi:2-hydroxychromene-2-carboxylate isomerase
MPIPISTTLYTDPACPWGYSASPALRVLEWRYGSQLDWRLVVIGLTENAEQYVARGFPPLRIARGTASFRRYGMPFALEPKARASATARACRAIVAAGMQRPGAEWEAFRALQLAWFTTPLVLDEDGAIEAALRRAPGLDAGAAVRAIDDPEVLAAYEAGRTEARSAAGSPTAFQGKAANTDGEVRYTAPSLVLRRGEQRLEAGGFQPVEAYDVLIANLDPTLERHDPPEDVSEILARFPAGVTTQEVAAILARGNDAPDAAAAEDALIDAVAAGAAARTALGDDALWTPRQVAADALRAA